MDETECKELVAIVEKMLFKAQEIASMMKQGQFIVGYEKLGGLIKNLSYVGARLQKHQSVISTEHIK